MERSEYMLGVREKQLAQVREENEGLRQLMDIYNAYLLHFMQSADRIKKTDIAECLKRARKYSVKVHDDGEYYTLTQVYRGEDHGKGQQGPVSEG